MHRLIKYFCAAFFAPLKTTKMKTLIILSWIMLAATTTASAQLGNFANKIKNKINSKVTQRVDSKVDKQIDETLDAAEGKGSSTTEATSTVSSAPTANDTGIKSSGKFDFVPGELVIYTDDFADDEAGELPVNWNTNGTGEIVSLDKIPGKWLRLHKQFTYLSRNTKEFGENYTVEFDMVLQLKSNGWMYPEFFVGMFSSKDEPNTGNAFLKDQNKNASVNMKIYPAEYKGSRASLKSYFETKSYYSSENKSYGDLEKYYGKPVHVAFQVQKERMRVWINQEKMFDAPKAIPAGVVMNQLFFEVSHTNYPEDQYGVYVGNLKVATGKPDTRHKLVEEGKFSTTGILFDVNAASIKPESNGVIKELADVLIKYPEIKIKIVGHTDSDGSDAANLELSKKRAAAVKEALTRDFSIDAARMETGGKGESEAVGDNKTKEGKAQNRRVEFIKIP
jgi:outer membrane protein OmpA-like peptidoglycan-associated protein